jgi:hypothetical protein
VPGGVALCGAPERRLPAKQPMVGKKC